MGKLEFKPDPSSSMVCVLSTPGEKKKDFGILILFNGSPKKLFDLVLARYFNPFPLAVTRVMYFQTLIQCSF